MCRNIKTLFNFDPPATDEEIRDASIQFVRKISGAAKPARTNEAAFYRAVDDIAKCSKQLMQTLVTNAPSRSREVETQKAHERAIKRFGSTDSKA